MIFFGKISFFIYNYHATYYVCTILVVTATVQRGPSVFFLKSNSSTRSFIHLLTRRTQSRDARYYLVSMELRSRLSPNEQRPRKPIDQSAVLTNERLAAEQRQAERIIHHFYQRVRDL